MMSRTAVTGSGVSGTPWTIKQFLLLYWSSASTSLDSLTFFVSSWDTRAAVLAASSAASDMSIWEDLYSSCFMFPIRSESRMS